MSNYPYDPNGRTPYDQNAQTEPSAGRPFSQGGGMPYGQGNSLTPPPPPPPQYSMNPGYTNYPPQPFQPPMPPPFQRPTPPPPGKPKGSAVKIGVIASIVAVLVIASFVGVFVLLVGKPGGSTANATPTSVPYPVLLVNSYAGTVRNSVVNSNVNVSFTSIAQTQGNVSGNITVGLPLVGSGPFSGTVSSSGAVHLVDVSNDGSNVKIIFTGSVSADKSMSGTYTVNNDQAGSWQVVPATTPVVYPVLYAKYSGTYTNNSTSKTGNLSLELTTQNQQTFSGNFTVDAGSVGLTGTVGSDNSIQFTVVLSDATLTFKGTDNTDGSLGGTYIYTATSASGGTNGNGTWKVSPA